VSLFASVFSVLGLVILIFQLSTLPIYEKRYPLRFAVFPSENHSPNWFIDCNDYDDESNYKSGIIENGLSQNCKEDNPCNKNCIIKKTKGNEECYRFTERLNLIVKDDVLKTKTNTLNIVTLLKLERPVYVKDYSDIRITLGIKRNIESIILPYKIVFEPKLKAITPLTIQKETDTKNKEINKIIFEKKDNKTIECQKELTHNRKNWSISNLLKEQYYIDKDEIADKALITHVELALTLTDYNTELQKTNLSCNKSTGFPVSTSFIFTNIEFVEIADDKILWYIIGIVLFVVVILIIGLIYSFKGLRITQTRIYNLKINKKDQNNE
jgi:hypothetical protein